MTLGRSTRRIHGLLTESEVLEFWSNVNVAEPDSCWLFGNARSYGSFSTRGVSFVAHRLSWVLANNREIPEGLFVCHSCDVKSCVNPNHLWIGTHSDNMRDALAKGVKSSCSNADIRRKNIESVPLSQRSRVAMEAYRLEQEGRQQLAAQRRTERLTQENRCVAEKQINIRLTPHDLAVLDQLRKDADGFPSRSDVVRDLIRAQDQKAARNKRIAQ